MLETLDLLILFVYLFSVIGVGIYFSKRAKSSEGFMVGGRSMSGLSVGLSIMGTLLSSVSFIAYTGKAFAENWNALLFCFTVILVAFVAVKFFLPFYRNTGTISAYTFLEERFGYWARFYGSLSFILYSIGRIGIILYLLCLPLHHLLGWNMIHLIIITGFVTTIYTFIGGIEAVIWTDVAQMIVLFFGALFCVFVLYQSIPEGISRVIEIAKPENKISFGSVSLDFSENTIWVVLLFGITENLRNFGVDQTYIQRYVATKTDREAVKSVWLGALTYAPITLLFFIIGTGLYVFYKIFPDPNLPQVADSVFPYFIVNQLPNGVKGLLIAALFAAAMSSISSSLNCMATISVEDFLKRFSDQAQNEVKVVRWLKLFTVMFGLIGVFTGIAMLSVKQALDISWQISGVFGGGVLGLVLVGMFSKRPKSKIVVPALIVGTLVIAWITFSPVYTQSEKILAGFFGTVAMILVVITLFQIPSIRETKKGHN